MSPLLFVFAPIIVGGVVFVALLFGAATAGTWEALEGCPRRTPPDRNVLTRAEPLESARAQAA
jgi:hypothetical protein